ncbi:methionyl-tRNA formyltransferase [candidate division KSB3 bacterium]|uniref:Methionyl-tRNA formyltransferase n=1 Tax=candidate division KSB3 bacterium TaxID=2044937 RepID=A0A2G6KD54_9BACT|nr:MAG: methionyl-tRNA formyltransferase [candidate division KSB3 bacterium]
MNVVFMGTPDFAVPTLQQLIDYHYNVLAVITQPDRAKGRGRNVVSPPVKLLAQEHKIPVLQPEKVSTEKVVQALKELAPDVIVVVAYGQILPESILRIPPRGCINIHGSLLPKYRGAAPIHWAIIRGETETGITTMFMDKGMDTGDMLLTRSLPITSDDTTGRLYDTLSLLGAELLIETLQQLEAGTLQRIPQDSAQATYAPMLKKEDGVINWNEPAVEIDRKVRGLFPWPGAYTYFRGKMAKILQVECTAEPAQAKDILPGTVVALDKTSGPLIMTGFGCIRLLRVQPQNKNAMDCHDFCRGYQLTIGSRFEMT